LQRHLLQLYPASQLLTLLPALRNPTSLHRMLQEQLPLLQQQQHPTSPHLELLQQQQQQKGLSQ
jgi:hypothetical protein